MKLLHNSNKPPTFASQFRGIAVKLNNGSVVQLVRIHACHAWGRGFESRPDRRFKVKKSLVIVDQRLFYFIQIARR